MINLLEPFHENNDIIKIKLILRHKSHDVKCHDIKNCDVECRDIKSPGEKCHGMKTHGKNRNMKFHDIKVMMGVS